MGNKQSAFQTQETSLGGSVGRWIIRCQNVKALNTVINSVVFYFALGNQNLFCLGLLLAIRGNYITLRVVL